MSLLLLHGSLLLQFTSFLQSLSNQNYPVSLRPKRVIPHIGASERGCRLWPSTYLASKPRGMTLGVNRFLFSSDPGCIISTMTWVFGCYLGFSFVYLAVAPSHVSGLILVILCPGNVPRYGSVEPIGSLGLFSCRIVLGPIG